MNEKDFPFDTLYLSLSSKVPKFRSSQFALLSINFRFYTKKKEEIFVFPSLLRYRTRWSWRQLPLTFYYSVNDFESKVQSLHTLSCIREYSLYSGVSLQEKDCDPGHWIQKSTDKIAFYICYLYQVSVQWPVDHWLYIHSSDFRTSH